MIILITLKMQIQIHATLNCQYQTQQQHPQQQHVNILTIQLPHFHPPPPHPTLPQNPNTLNNQRCSNGLICSPARQPLPHLPPSIHHLNPHLLQLTTTRRHLHATSSLLSLFLSISQSPNNFKAQLLQLVSGGLGAPPIYGNWVLLV